MGITGGSVLLLLQPTVAKHWLIERVKKKTKPNITQGYMHP